MNFTELPISIRRRHTHVEDCKPDWAPELKAWEWPCGLVVSAKYMVMTDGHPTPDIWVTAHNRHHELGHEAQCMPLVQTHEDEAGHCTHVLLSCCSDDC